MRSRGRRRIARTCGFSGGRKLTLRLASQACDEPQHTLTCNKEHPLHPLRLSVYTWNIWNCVHGGSLREPLRGLRASRVHNCSAPRHSLPPAAHLKYCAIYRGQVQEAVKGYDTKHIGIHTQHSYALSTTGLCVKAPGAAPPPCSLRTHAPRMLRRFNAGLACGPGSVQPKC